MFFSQTKCLISVTYQEAYLDNDCKFGTTFVRQKASQNSSVMPFGFTHNQSLLQINEPCLAKINL